MNQIKKLIDKVSAAEAKRSQTVIIPLDDARLLRDEVTKLLVDLQANKKDIPDPVLNVVVTGGKFKNG